MRARLGEWDNSAADFERAAAIAGKGDPGWSRTGWWRVSSDPEGIADPFTLREANETSSPSAKPPRWYASADDPNGWVPVTRNPPTLATRIYAAVPRDIRLRTDRYVLDSWWNGRPAKLEPGTHRLALRKGWNALVLRFAAQEGLDAELGKPNSGLYARLFSDDAPPASPKETTPKN